MWTMETTIQPRTQTNNDAVTAQQSVENTNVSESLDESVLTQDGLSR